MRLIRKSISLSLRERHSRIHTESRSTWDAIWEHKFNPLISIVSISRGISEELGSTIENHFFRFHHVHLIDYFSQSTIHPHCGMIKIRGWVLQSGLGYRGSRPQGHSPIPFFFKSCFCLKQVKNDLQRFPGYGDTSHG